MLINMKELLKVAKANKFAVGAFNVTELLNFKTVFETAEKFQSPTIIAATGQELEFCGPEYYQFVIQKLSNSKVPYVLHLDHGHSLQECLKAIQAGFTSVMFDGSHLPFEENILNTKQIVDIAHKVNVSVEGELGTIGNLNNSEEGDTSDIIYTKPEEAAEFATKTGIDSLAVAIGTSHGLYPEGYKPKLQLDLLERIANSVDIPLVLHGGSGQDDSQIEKACKIGVQKINVASEYKASISREMARIVNEEDDFKFVSLMPKASVEARKIIEHKMEVFGSKNKSYLYYSDLKKGN